MDESLRVQTIISKMESKDPGADLTELRKLADDLFYSEPAQAASAAERELAKSMDELEGIVPIFMSDAGSELSVRGALSEAVDAVGRALSARNEAILRSK